MTKKAINLAVFNTLSQDLQLNVLQDDGVHVGKRIVKGRKVILYQLYGFYIEVFYLEYRKKIDYIAGSESAEILEPYLNQIHIKDLDETETLD